MHLNGYRSQAMWSACCDLSESKVGARIVGRHESVLRRLSERRSRQMFTRGLYVYSEWWGPLVIESCSIVAARVGYAAPIRSLRELRPAWISLSRRADLEDEDIWSAYVALRHANTWRSDHPGTMAVVAVLDHSDHVRDGLERLFESAARYGWR